MSIEGDWDGFFRLLEAGEHAQYYTYLEHVAQGNLLRELRREWTMNGREQVRERHAPFVVDAA